MLLTKFSVVTSEATQKIHSSVYRKIYTGTVSLKDIVVVSPNSALMVRATGLDRNIKAVF